MADQPRITPFPRYSSALSPVGKNSGWQRTLRDSVGMPYLEINFSQYGTLQHVVLVDEILLGRIDSQTTGKQDSLWALPGTTMGRRYV